MGLTRSRREIDVQVWIILPLELQPSCVQIKEDQLAQALIKKQHYVGLIGFSPLITKLESPYSITYLNRKPIFK